MPLSKRHPLVRHFFESKTVGVFSIDRQMEITAWNGFMEELTGHSGAVCEGMQVQEVIGKYDEQELVRLKKAFNGNSFSMKERPLLIHRTTGQVHYCDFFYTPLYEGEKDEIAEVMVLVSQSLQQQRKSLNQIRQTLSTLSAFLRYAPMPVYIIDRQYEVKLANDAFNYYIGTKNSVGCKIDELKIKEDNALQIKHQVDEVLESGEPVHAGESFERDHTVFYFYIIKFPIRNLQGEIEAVGGYGIDITEKVLQEERIHQLLAESLKLNDQLEQKNEELEKNRKTLSKTNRALKKQTRELEKALSELSDRNYELDQIMYKTSHDLRAPLTSILGLLNLIRNEKDKEQVALYHTHIKSRIEKLDGFVKSMLSYARNSRTAINLQPIDWNQLIEEAFSQLEYLKNYSKIRKEIDCQCETSFHSDPFRLGIIFNNLIGNAIKYADLHKPDPYLKIEVNTFPDRAEISIHDNGIGIEKQYMEKLGGMFFRATNSAEGSGLGMYIVLQTLEKLKGKFSITSTLQEGTNIHITLPSLGQPVADRKPEKAAKQPTAKAVASGKKR